MGKTEVLLHLLILCNQNSKRVITVFESSRRKFNILNSKYYESPFEK